MVETVKRGMVQGTTQFSSLSGHRGWTVVVETLINGYEYFKPPVEGLRFEKCLGRK
jgi:hypothetical protein